MKIASFIHSNKSDLLNWLSFITRQAIMDWLFDFFLRTGKNHVQYCRYRKTNDEK
jgi:hypothetical protein